ncbi:MAG: hypothetical protein WAV15_04055 [Minisyncoccia bacterium]
MKNKSNSQQGGFLQIIIGIIIVLIIMKLLGITLSGFFGWFSSFFSDVLR